MFIKMLENECGNYKGFNYKENIYGGGYISGGDDFYYYNSESCSIYFIDRKKVIILNKIDFNYAINGLCCCKNYILYASLYKKVGFSYISTIKIIKIRIDNDDDQIYEDEKIYSFKNIQCLKISDVIKIKNKIIAFSFILKIYIFLAKDNSKSSFIFL